MRSVSSFNLPPQDDGEPTYDIPGSGDSHMPQGDDKPIWPSGFNFYPPPFQGEPGSAGINGDDLEQRNPINGKIMVMAITVFILVMLFVFFLPFYSRWFSARLSRRNRRRSASMRHRFYFIEEEPARLRNVGLDSAVLETLPIFVYKSQSFTDGLECAVCLCEFEENEKGRLLPNCRHNFHVECIDMWFRSHSTCPLCRTGAQPEQPVLESVRIEQISVTVPGPIPSGIPSNLNSEQGQTASSGEEYNGQNPTNIFSRDRQKQMNADIDQGTSGGRALIMPQIGIEIPKRPDGFSFPGEAHQLCSPNGSQSSSKSPVSLLRSLTRMLSRDRERIQVFPTDHPNERDVENNGPAQGQ